MKDNYADIVQHNVETLCSRSGGAATLADWLPGIPEDDGSVRFQAFGEPCRLGPEGIYLSEIKQEGPVGIIISLYALAAGPRLPVMEPFRAFKDFPGSMPYAGAFAAYTQDALVPHVDAIGKRVPEILNTLGGITIAGPPIGDFSFCVMPLPKIALLYIFYEADEDFPAAVTCLFSANAADFMPMDGLADTGEYTSRKIIRLLE